MFGLKMGQSFKMNYRKKTSLSHIMVNGNAHISQSFF